MTCDVASSVQFGRHSRVENTKLGKSSFFLGGELPRINLGGVAFDFLYGEKDHP